MTDFSFELSPSLSATLTELLWPCDICGRTFVKESLERHAKICESLFVKKKNSKEEKKIKLGTKQLSTITSTPVEKKRVSKQLSSESNEECKYCGRKFGVKAFDRHVIWCEEKSRRLQPSPNKDLVAIAKYQMRINYKANTPPVSRKNSEEETIVSKSRATPSCMSTSLIIEPRKNSFFEESETSFVRSNSGRGSIKRPAQTKASQLRQVKNELATSKTALSEPIYKKNNNNLNINNHNNSNNNTNWSESPILARKSVHVVRPHVIRPPKAIGSLTRCLSSEPVKGKYDHSSEYDPYRLAADQMNELLFGPNFLKSSSGSAFDKYIPFIESSESFNSKNLAKFCHECGNLFSLPQIKYCCECGIKRLYT